MTASQPVCVTMAQASSGVRMSPLPITGIFTASLIAAIHSQRAFPLYPCSRVRACNATAASPHDSAMRASSTQTISSSLHPARNFTVNGTFTAGLTASKMRRNRMFVFIKMEVALGLLVLLAEHAIGRGELSHDQPTAIQVADEPPEDRVGNAGHRRQHSG